MIMIINLILVNSNGYNLTWVNCEMASFIHMKSSEWPHTNDDSIGGNDNDYNDDDDDDDVMMMSSLA